MSETYRIARYLARCGVASRRKSEDLILEGRVMVNGAPVTDLGTQIVPGVDRVEFDGRELELAEKEVTLAFHKPRRILVSRTGEKGRSTVYDCLPIAFAPLAPRLVYAGRLDFLSEGLLIMTTDGELANRLTHPSHRLEKEYHAWTDRELTAGEEQALRDGVELEDGLASVRSIRRLPPRKGNAYAVVVEEGRNRLVRRLFASQGAQVERLVRMRIGRFSLKSLGVGEWRMLTRGEIGQLTTFDDLELNGR